MYGTYPEYHTSLDNKDFVSFEALQESIAVYFETCRVLEANRTFKNTVMFGEPQLGKRGLYPTLGSQKETDSFQDALRWLLNFSDGKHDLLSVALLSGSTIFMLEAAAQKCLDAGLLTEVANSDRTFVSA